MGISKHETELSRACPALCLVVPCFNEAEVLPRTLPEFTAELERLIAMHLVSEESSVLLVDDGSIDGTWAVIDSFCETSQHVNSIKLSRNYGHQNALLAGLMESKGLFDVYVSIDCDGQDDIGALREMLSEYASGSDVVYGVRSNRQSDAWLKRVTAEGFYRMMMAMGTESIFNHADYRLLSNRAVEALSRFEESNLFLRGLVPLIGFKSTKVEYERQERIAGRSHYSIRKMLGLALDGITSLSVKPIRFITAMGVALFIMSIVGIIWAIVAFLMGTSVPGWSSLLVAILLVGGLQLLSLGVIGEYVGRIYIESKRRPRYIVERSTFSANDRLE